MKKTIQSIIKMVLIFALCVQLMLSSTALSISSVTPVDPGRSYAMQMVQMVDSDDIDCPWNDTTLISSMLPLYDHNGVVNGYIYNLSTDGQDTGYIQLFYKDDVYSLLGFAYEGRHYIENMIRAYTQKATSRHDLQETKIVYAGGMDYFLKQSSGVYYDLSNQAEIPADQMTEIQDNYAQLANKIVTKEVQLQRQNATRSTADTGVKRYVTGTNNLDIVATSDFAGCTIGNHVVTGHCAPTAATTIVKYWANRRGVTNLYYNSDWWVFSSLYVNMNTNNINQIPGSNHNGTWYYDILPGLRNYSVQTRGVSISGWDWWGDITSETVTFEKAQAYINADIPFIGLQTRTSAQSNAVVGHAIVCFGYYTVDGRQQLIVANGDDKSWHFLDFDSLDLFYYQYVRWD